jgi:hypothetical protein
MVKKYRLVVDNIQYDYDNNISLDGIVDIISIMPKYSLKKGMHALHIIQKDPNYVDQYNSICKNIKRLIDEQPHLKSKITKLDKYYENGRGQIGGGLEMLLGLGGSVFVSAIIGAIVYYVFFKKTKKCRDEYPLYPEDQVPSIKDVLFKVVPNSWIENAEDLDPDTYVGLLREKLERVRKPFELLSPKSNIGKLALGVARVSAGVGAAVATLGTGGDAILNLVFVMKDSIEVISAVMQQLIEMVDDTQALRFIYDVFNIDFRDGPFGVSCWIKFILNTYGEDSQVYISVCSFLNIILAKLADFIGSLISSMIPNSVGLVGMIVAEVMKHAKKGAFDMAISKLNYYYNKIPADKQLLLQNPQMMKAYLDKKILKIKAYLLGLGGSLFETLVDNTEFFSVTIHNLLALVYTILYSLASCSIA